VTVPYPGVYGVPPQQPNAPPPQQYPPQQYAPQYPPQQGYVPQPAPVQQPLAQGTLDEFYNQPSAGGGAALKFEQIGTRYVGIVSRPIGNGDIQQQTDVHGRPQTFKDGRPKFVMKVPLQMQPTPQYPDGLAQWYVKGQARDELVRAMAEAGAPEGPPEAGAIVDVTFVSQRPAGAGMNPAKQFQVHYQRPNGAAPAAPQQAAQAPVAQQPAPPTNYAQAPVQQQLPPQQYQQPPAQYAEHAAPQGYAPQPAYAQQAAPQVVQQPVPQSAPPVAPTPGTAVPQPPADLSPEQQQLLARLTGQQAQAQG
jgi:hypothetical protein